MKLPTDVPVASGRPFIELAREIAAAILLTVEAGWMHALRSSQPRPSEREVVLTEKLRDGMREALESGALGWKGRMAVLPGTESRSRPDVRVPDGRTDIPVFLIAVFLRFGEHDPHAIIECKRIAGSNAHLCREYVVEGVERFQVGKYGGNHSTGFMVGYFLAGDATEAAARINRHLRRKSRTSEQVTASDVVPASWAWQSRHPREAGSPIELHHSFLSFVMA